VKTLAFAATMILGALAVAETRQTKLVKGSPTDYGTNGFDVSWVDNSAQKSYLADRNNQVFVPVSGKGIFVARPAN
jgi:hypothetical protein